MKNFFLKLLRPRNHLYSLPAAEVGAMNKSFVTENSLYECLRWANTVEEREHWRQQWVEVRFDRDRQVQRLWLKYGNRPKDLRYVADANKAPSISVNFNTDQLVVRLRG